MREATKKAKADYTSIQADYDTLKQEVTQFGNYLNVEDHVITQGMKSRVIWKKQALQTSKEFAYLKALVNTHDITCADIDMNTLEVNLNNLRDMIFTKIENIEEADEKRGLYYDDPGAFTFVKRISIPSTPQPSPLLWLELCSEVLKAVVAKLSASQIITQKQAVLTYLPDPDLHHGQVQSEPQLQGGRQYPQQAVLH